MSTVIMITNRLPSVILIALALALLTALTPSVGVTAAAAVSNARTQLQLQPAVQLLAQPSHQNSTSMRRRRATPGLRDLPVVINLGLPKSGTTSLNVFMERAYKRMRTPYTACHWVRTILTCVRLVYTLHHLPLDSGYCQLNCAFAIHLPKAPCMAHGIVCLPAHGAGATGHRNANRTVLSPFICPRRHAWYSMRTSSIDMELVPSGHRNTN